MAALFKIGRSKNWYISYYVNGKRITKSLKTFDEKVARFMKKELEVKLSKGLHEEIQKKSLQICLDEYLASNAHRKQRSNDNEESAINKFIKNSSVTALSKISTDTILSFLKNYDTNAPQTFNNTLSCLKRFLNFAVNRNYIRKNPAASIRNKKIPQKEVKYFTDEEYLKIEQTAEKHPLYPMIVTARYTGLRLLELVNLEWEDFDWKRKVVFVKNKKDHTTKNYKNRTVPICEEFQDKLLPYIKNEGICFPVFSGPTKGSKYSEQGPKDTIRRIFENAKVQVEKGKSWHKFRKTFATKLKDAGVSIAKISDWLGHSSIRVTEMYLGCNSFYDEDIEKLSVSYETAKPRPK